MMLHNGRIPIQDLRITVVFDNNPGVAGISPEWGFSCLIQGIPRTILFDTGCSGTTLLNNLKRLRISPGEIEMILISHFHGDHIGGLVQLFDQNRHAAVYIPASFPEKFTTALMMGSGIKTQAVGAATKICDGVYTTGPLGIWIKEQSLMIATDKGTVLITGCAHPGIVSIVKTARNLLGLDVFLVMGGFHLGGMGERDLAEIIEAFKKLEVTAVAPCHCSGDLARRLLKTAFGLQYVDIGAGSVIHFDGGIRHNP